MDAALEQARLALAAGEVPIGAVLVIDDAIVAREFQPADIGVRSDRTRGGAGAREAARIVGNYRLTTADVYVTLEPCLMCVGALVHARVRRFVCGAVEPKTGALVSTHAGTGDAGAEPSLRSHGPRCARGGPRLIQEFSEESAGHNAAGTTSRRRSLWCARGGP